MVVNYPRTVYVVTSRILERDMGSMAGSVTRAFRVRPERESSDGAWIAEYGQQPGDTAAG